MSRAGDCNSNTIAELRKNKRRVGGNFAGAPLLLLDTKGARSVEPRVSPVIYLRHGDRHPAFASNAGAPNNSAWYRDLKVHPDIKIQVGKETLDVHAKEITGSQRDRLYARQSSLYPAFAEYERLTKRKIPVTAVTARRASS